jgi:hypothetical protein
MVKTFVGYLDVVINLKSPLNHHDIECNVYISSDNDSMQQPSPAGISTFATKKVYGPILLSDVANDAKTSGMFTVVSPALLTEKSLSVLVKLRTITGDGSSLAKPSSIIKDLYVGVHQLKSIIDPSNLFFNGCQSALASEGSVHRSFVTQLLDLFKSNGDLSEHGSIKKIITLLLWIVSIYQFSSKNVE